MPFRFIFEESGSAAKHLVAASSVGQASLFLVEEDLAVEEEENNAALS